MIEQTHTFKFWRRRKSKSGEKTTGVLKPVEQLLDDSEVQSFLALENRQIEVQTCRVLANEIQHQASERLRA